VTTRSAFLLALTTALVGCASTTRPATGPDPKGAPTVLGYAFFDVDPQAPPEERIRVRTEWVSDAAAAPKSQGSVLGDVVLSGPGVWNADTERLSARVRITNGTSHDLDEPQMVLDTLSRDAVTAELVHSGDGGLGSVWAFADIARSGGANGGSARQRIRFHAPGGVAFSFSVQVIADPAPRRGIDPDDDDDGYNSERDQPAGDDCDDRDPTVYPGRGGCQCLSSCDVCGEGECCQQACTGQCECPLGCSCDYESTWSGEDPPDVVCGDASCDLSCESYGHPCTISECDGSDCDLACASGSSACAVGSCSGSTCAAHCSSTSGGCSVDACEDGSDCAVDCTNGSGACGVGECTGSSCDLVCSRFGGPCRIEQCEGAACSVSCENSGGSCGIDHCEAGSTCSVSCKSSTSCSMSCEAGASCTLSCQQTGSCNLTCEGGAAIDCGGGVKVCPGIGCP
jgi:hypothetical protein